MYTPIEEVAEIRRATTSPAAIKWLGLAAVLVLSAVLVGSSLKTSSPGLSSENQHHQLRQGSSAASLHSDIVAPVS